MAYTYTTLSAAIGSWATRTYLSAQTDEFIMLAEAAINRRLDGYQREISTTITLTDGVGPLPAGFIRDVSVAHATYGPLRQVATTALADLNPLDIAGIPFAYAISGSSLKTAEVYTGDLSLIYLSSLTPLSSGNASNWLLALAPDAYLFMCKAMQRAFEEEWGASQGFAQQAGAILDDLTAQNTVAQHGRATVALPGSTP